MKAMLQPTFVPCKRKYLFCGDQKGMERLTPIIQRAQKENHPYESVLVDEKEETDIMLWLQDQKMGSFLYIAMEWNRLACFMKIAEGCGFSEEESHYIGHGERIINVFCCKCHQKTKVNGEMINTFTSCSHCHLSLSVSEHYSPLQESYLGYPATIESGSGHC